MILAELLARALREHRAGRLPDAEQTYGQILRTDPDQPDALNGLGVLAYQAGQHQTALTYLGRAVELRPEAGAFHSNLGLASLALGLVEQAVASFRRAIQLLPRAAQPYFNLGNALKEQKRLDEACACYRQALALKPDHVVALNNLGNALREQGQAAPAVDCYRRALALRPDYAEAINNLGAALRDLGQSAEAEACCRRALDLSPQLAAAWNNLACILQDQRRTDLAAGCYRRVLEIDPANPLALDSLGHLLLDDGWIGEAVLCFQQLVVLRPQDASAWAALANARLIQGEIEQGDTCYRRALELQPDFALAHSGWLYWQQYRPDTTLATLAAAHSEWDRRHGGVEGAKLTQRRPPAIGHSPGGPRRLRLGFVSADFGRHPVGYFCIRALEGLARQGFDIVCYCNKARDDDLALRFQRAATLWREAWTLSDDALAEQIVADRIDILFDLAGHTGANRLPVFARKPAPVQITWIGSEGTTGLATMDYILGDASVIPPGVEPHYREQVLRLPEVYVCYAPPCDSPAVGPLPALTCGRVTFGCFNNPAKINPAVVAAWVRILHRIPGSRLVLKYTGLTDPGVRERFLKLFSAHDVAADCLEFQGWSPHAEMLSQYNRIDLALDPFPFVGGATTCEALWMGVPVLTWPGDTFAGRHSLSYLSAVGLTRTIARTLDDYVAQAVALAGDLPGLAALRSGLRPLMAGSTLCDGERFSGQLAALLRLVA